MDSFWKIHCFILRLAINTLTTFARILFVELSFPLLRFCIGCKMIAAGGKLCTTYARVKCGFAASLDRAWNIAWAHAREKLRGALVVRSNSSLRLYRGLPRPTNLPTYPSTYRVSAGKQEWRIYPIYSRVFGVHLRRCIAYAMFP